MEEVAFANKLKNEYREQVGHSRLNTQDPMRFLIEEIQMEQDFVQNQELLKQRMKIQSDAEKALRQEVERKKNGVMVLDVDDDFQDVQLETDMVETTTEENQTNRENYDFENYDFINANDSGLEQLENLEEQEEEHSEESDPKSDDDEKRRYSEDQESVQERHFMDSLQNQQIVKNPPSIAELS